MTGAQRKQFQKLLLQLRDELSGKGLQRIEPNRTDATDVGSDEDEQPLNEMMQSIASSRNRNAAQVLVKIDKALRRLAEEPDDFGLCELCDEEILLGRLKAMPYAELCTDCQSKRDAPKGGPTRKKLTDYID